MIKLRIAELCEERLIKNAYTALVKAGISAVKTRQYLDAKTNRLMLDDVEKLCRLLHCTPNDLMEWTPTNKAHDYEGNPLQAIRKKPPFNLTDILNGMTIGEQRELLAKYEEEKRKEK